MNAHPPIEQLLPHGDAMRFVRSIEEMNDVSARCRARFGATAPLVADGRVPAYLILEAAAQCAAVRETLQRLQRDGQASLHTGYLVSVRDVRLHCATLPVEHDFEVEIRDSGSAPPLATFTLRAWLDGELVAEGRLSTYVE